MLTTHIAEVQSADGIAVQIWPSFISEFGRKLYIVDPGFVMRIPAHAAHAHGWCDVLVPISGDIWIASSRPSGEVSFDQLVPGQVHRTRPNVPHQIEIRGGILESIFPTWVYEKKAPMYELPGGYFE